ncbi:MAG: DUF2065 domain-containing protein [Proteobacteria bacterium]|nr:DUF2065 domain-containing protein [Pseudomonadota bacterium]
MDWSDLGTALALVLIIEGLLPLLSPRSFRQAMIAAVQMNDRVLRTVGLATMVTGVLLVYWIR